ncbi:putative kinetochore protein NDC80 [Suhomyces tanzawaensis NRRL Y-17324]|uniref:Kinetochore protein NDC80 n=1 Tax=Suhomyces tanzawaensis NRRL Y-17324 TaxID=984487 RepID=A0A1E4SRL8_9ASCO|nr:putative kinetochore protein NDC80 [Suhomyces tanzawaensis NRRL Y-17324]ODV82156.1 putative kinetochore protein NDC80 [Suhomyces tanzawaensis NRRL Y-17324]
MNSNVAAPSSLLRKNTGKNLSMGSATRTSLLGSRNILDAISGTNSAKRRSLLSTPASTNKRRQSLSGQALHPPSSSSSQQTPQTSTPIDQRPLRDKNYQQLIQQEIYDFLVTNRFELEMNHTITLKTLKQPTQKDFILIFKFLYNKIDPYYEFHKSIEVEVFSLLKILNYPYLDSINRSQISAVGGQNWPSFLGILYWMIKLNLSILNLNIDDSLISPDDEFDKIFIKYIRDSYQAFINEQDDYSEFYEEMKIEFEKLNSNLLQDIKNLETDNDRLRLQHSELNGQLIELQQAEKKSVALEDDLIKFKAYIETMENRKSKWSEIIDKIKEEITNRDEELQGINQSQKELENQILQKGITISEINNLNIERDKLSKAIDLISSRLEDAQSKLNDKDIELIKNYQSLENFIKQYNNLILKTKSPNYDFEIKLLQTAINSISQEASDNDKYVSLKPNDIINKVLKDEKIELLKFRSEINSKIHQYQDEQIKIQEQCDLVIEKNLEQSEYLEGLGSKLTASKMNYDEIYETMINDSTTYSTQIEKLERELRSIKINTNQGFIELENQYQNTLIEHDELTHSLAKSRKALFDKCCKMAEFIMNFKLSIQTNLLDLDDLAMIEYEKEQKEGEQNLQ